MGDIDVRIRQSSVIELLKAKDEMWIRIHDRLKNGHDDVIVDISTVRRWTIDEVKEQTPLTNGKWSDIVKIGWEILPHISYSPGEAPSNFHLLGSLKKLMNQPM
ncbi:hypothetical protein Trydic_g580 [Trypoxylus dichotomus]